MRTQKISLVDEKNPTGTYIKNKNLRISIGRYFMSSANKILSLNNLGAFKRIVKRHFL